jgi:hypothetical protein
VNRYKLYITAGVALASLIAAPAFQSFKPSQNKHIAEGSPLPPVPPPGSGNYLQIIAEGSPLPPVPPPVQPPAAIASIFA